MIQNHQNDFVTQTLMKQKLTKLTPGLIPLTAGPELEAGV